MWAHKPLICLAILGCFLLAPVSFAGQCIGHAYYYASGDPPCASGEHWVGFNGSSNKWRKCENGTISDMSAGAGSGITSLGGQTGATQTFTHPDDTNVVLTVSSATDNHAFTMSWTGLLASTRGGTGNGFFAVSGPASTEKIFTFPNASATVLTDNGTVTVAQGGSGVGTLTGLLQGNGASAFTAIANSSTVGQALRVTGVSAYAWGALDLADADAVTGLLPDANIAASLSRDTEAPGAGDITGSLSAGYQIGSGAVGAAELATAHKTLQITYTFFDTGTDLPDTLDVPSIFPNRSRAITLTEVYCEIDAGSASINLQRDDGTPANILSANLACSTAGATSTGFVAGEDAIAVGQNIDHVTVSVGAGLRRLNVAVKYTVN